MSGYVSDAVIRRLPLYYRHLHDLEQEGVKQISSQELGERMQLTPSQIRQDINSFGGFGRQGYGYPVRSLKEHIRKIMGLDEEHRMVIVGAGRIGTAIAQYAFFEREGFITVAMFDSEPEKVCPEDKNRPVYPVAELEKRIPELKPDIAVLTLPAESAQGVLDRLYALGVRAVWNFAPVDLHHPRDLALVNVHLSDSLHILSYRMHQMKTEEDGDNQTI